MSSQARSPTREVPNKPKEDEKKRHKIVPRAISEGPIRHERRNQKANITFAPHIPGTQRPRNDDIVKEGGGNGGKRLFTHDMTTTERAPHDDKDDCFF